MKHNMLGSIHQVLSHLGIDFNKAHRPLQLTFGDPHLNEHFYLQFVCGHTAINEGLELKLLCLSTSAYLPLKDFIGQVATIEQTTDQGLLHQLTGMITQAASGHHDGGFALYQLTLQDSFSSLLAKRRNSRVFMQKSVLEITQILSQEWQQQPTCNCTLTILI
ncbi:contractile injection system protein, VgrG/Pvc8 family [Alkanindiges sp. WGS2144]|uniref:contractile injection system protein, VgrG/Pvc8 family n=1 Tax=Alkanindiges sp. WGS2144 TaxID=3366808 RepID=UPI00375043BE